MLKIKMMLAAMLLSAGAFAQQALITGTVRDAKSNQTLPGATIKVSPGLITVSDEFGRFRFEKLVNGEYSVTVSFLGYQDKTENVSIADRAEITILLEESYQLTDEVVVYATRANDKTPTTYTNVNQQAIQKQNFGQDMPFILNWTPSLVTTSDAGAGIGYTGVRIRGSDATRINVTINGIAYNDSESQGTFWVNMPDIASSTQSVQIQRGVGTSTNGAGSFGGSVNVQTISQQRDPYAEVMLGGGSFNSQRYTVKAGTGLINDHWSFDGRASKIKSDGYIDRASSDLDSYYFSGGFYGDKTIVKAIVFGGQEVTYQSWNGIDGETMKRDRTFNSAGALYDENGVTGYYDNEVDNYKQDHYQLHLTQKLSDHWNANVSLHYTYGRGYYEQYKQSKSFDELGLEDLVIGDSTITASDVIIRKWLDNQFYGTTFSLNYEKARNAITIGGAYNQYARAKHFGEIIWAQHVSNSSIRDHYYEGESQKNDFNVYAKWNYAITEKWNAFVDLQYRNVLYTTKGTDDDDELTAYDFDDNLNFFNPKAGISFSPNQNDLFYASYAVANREPNRSDYINGASKPRPERLDNIEVGWRRMTSNYSIEANYYLMNYTDQLVLTGELDNVGNPIRANVGKSYRTGIELSGMIKFFDQLTWNANVAFSANKNKDYIADPENPRPENTTITLSPGVIAGSQLTWSANGFQAGLLSKFVSKQYLDNTQTESLTLDSYFVNDLRFGYSFKPTGMKGIDLSILINNFLNEEYESNGATYGDGVAYYFPQAGINFLAMVTLKF